MVAIGTGGVAPAGGLEIYAVTDPTAPMLLGAVAFPASPRALATADDKVLVAFSDGLRTVDLADPTAPLEIGVAETPLGHATCTVIAAAHAFVSSTPGSLTAFDLSDWSQPQLIDRTTWMPFTVTDGDPMGGWGVAVAHGRLVVADGGFGVRIVDASRCRARLRTPTGEVISAE